MNPAEIPSEGGRLLPVRRLNEAGIAAVDPDGIQRMVFLPAVESRLLEPASMDK